MRKFKNIFVLLTLLFILIIPESYAEYTDEQIKEWYDHEIRKIKSASILADYMYNRIKYYQKFDTWYESFNAIEKNYETLQNMDLGDIK